MVEASDLPPARQGKKNRGISNASQRTGFQTEVLPYSFVAFSEAGIPKKK